MPISKTVAISRFFNAPSTISGPVVKAGVIEVKAFIDACKADGTIDQIAADCATALNDTLAD